MNSLNEAISVVHEPYSCSVMASISKAASPGTAGICVIVLPMVTPKTWATLLAGSVLTSSTRLPWRARWTAVAHAMLVLPTPPLPVKKKCRGASARKLNKSVPWGRVERGVQQQPESVDDAVEAPVVATGSSTDEQPLAGAASANPA